MIAEPEWIETDLAITVHRLQLERHGGLGGIRDEGLLDAAMHRPKHVFDYDDTATLFTLAAFYAHGLATGHPFIDGNKRTSFVVSVTFLALNGLRLHASDDAIHTVWTELASGTIGVSDLAEWFAANVTKAP